ncbi:MAG: restriction endonuclease subunit S, partial [Bacteroidales bacterium]
RFTVQAKKSEVLFTDYITEHINPSTGRAAIIVPNGIVSTTQSSYIQLRKLMVENSLVAVISLPAGVFQPYSGVKTSILILDKRLSKKSNQILFLKVEADGFDLGAQRRESDKNDLPLAIEVFQAYKQALNNGENFDVDCYSNLSLLVDKEIVLANKDIVLSAERYFEKEVSQTIFDLAKLIDVSEVIRGITFGKNDQVDLENNDTIKVATTKACQENGIVEKDLYNIPKRFVKEDKKYLQVGDILMSTANSLNLLGRTTYVEEINKKVSFGAFMSLIRSDNKKILPFYLLHCLRTDRAKLFFKLNANTTTNISNLSFEKLNSFEIPLPPLEIQQQIVAEIEAYQKIIDGAKQVVNNYKPTISIKPEWEMVELGDICEKITDGSHFSPDTVSEGFPYVTVRDINDSIVDLIDCKKINKEAYSVLVKSGCKPQKNDVLFSKDGTVGKVALIDFEADFVVLSSLAIITPNTKLIMPSFLSFILQSDFAFQQAINLKGGVAIKRVVLKDLKTIKIPNISTKEQTLIVQRIEEEQALVNANKRLITIFEKKIKDKINEVWGVKEEKEYETGEEEILLAAEPEE